MSSLGLVLLEVFVELLRGFIAVVIFIIELMVTASGGLPWLAMATGTSNWA